MNTPEHHPTHPTSYHDWRHKLKEGLLTGVATYQQGSINRILSELSASAYQHDSSDRGLQWAEDEIAALIAQARLAFRPVTSDRGPQFHLDRDDFVTAASGLQDEDGWKAAFDTLWVHEAPIEQLLKGYAGSLHGKHRLNPNVGQIEEVCRQYLSTPQLRSNTLEWAMIDGLVYAEIIAFAIQSGASRRIGTRVGPHGLERISFGNRMLGKLVSSAGLLFNEVFWIIIITLFAKWASLGNQIVTWMIGLTLVSWRWALIFGTRKDRNRQSALLIKMCEAPERLKTVSFNAGQVKTALLEAEKQGAVFSPWVYHLLDRR